MTIQSAQSVQRTFAVTIAFAIGAPVLTIMLFGIAELFGGLSGLPQGAATWLEAGVRISVLAAFAGLLVDAARLMARLFWRRKIPYRLKLHKVLKSNLA
jgi:hypothetical protein